MTAADQRKVESHARLFAVAPYEGVASDIVVARDHLGLEAEDIIRTTRVAPADLERIESGPVPPDPDVAGRFGVALDLPVGVDHRPAATAACGRDPQVPAPGPPSVMAGR